MYATKTVGKRPKTLTLGQTKKAAIEVLREEVKRLTGTVPDEGQFEVVEELDLTLVWRLSAAQKKVLAEGQGVVIKPA